MRLTSGMLSPVAILALVIMARSSLNTGQANSDQRNLSEKSATLINNDTTDHGFIQIDPNSRYFVFNDGTPYLPIGINKFALFRETHHFIDSITDQWASHGINYLRIWVGIGADPELEVGVFDEQQIEKLDFIIRRCRKKGIYLSICLWNENSLRAGNNDWGWDGNRQIYNLDNSENGTTKNAEDLKDVSHAASWTAMKNRYFYFINRWKDERAIMMWDLVNDSKKTANWKSQMYDFVKSIDNRHLITFQYNTGKNPGGEMDCGSVRVYDYNPPGNDPEEMTLSLVERIKEALVHGDPVYCGEGRMDYEKGTNANLKRGFLHMLWAPIAAGAAGNLHSWISINSSKDRWPDLSEQELGWIKSFSSFCQSIDWAQFNSSNAEHEISATRSDIRAFACRSSNQMLIYLMHDDKADKFRSVRTSLAITSQLMPRSYEISWIDIRSGKTIKRELISHLPASLKVPKFRAGIFARIKAI